MQVSEKQALLAADLVLADLANSTFVTQCGIAAIQQLRQRKRDIAFSIYHSLRNQQPTLQDQVGTGQENSASN